MILLLERSLSCFIEGVPICRKIKRLSDSVLLVALTILAYDLILPTLVNGQADPTEHDSFFDNLFDMVSSFFVIFVFWILYI